MNEDKKFKLEKEIGAYNLKNWSKRISLVIQYGEGENMFTPVDININFACMGAVDVKTIKEFIKYLNEFVRVRNRLYKKYFED